MNEPVTNLHSSSLNVIYLRKMADSNLNVSPTESNICLLSSASFLFYVCFFLFMDFPDYFDMNTFCHFTGCHLPLSGSNMDRLLARQEF